MSSVDFFAYFTLLICTTAVGLGYRIYRDTLHPLVYMGGLCAFLYGVMPLIISNGLPHYFSAGELWLIQFVNLLGVLALFLGVIFGSRKLKRSRQPGSISLPTRQRREVVKWAKILGIVSVLGFFYGIEHVGGLSAAYGHAYGGGSSSSGYIRELPLLSLPALIWLMTAYRGQRPPRKMWLWIALFALPLMVQGLLGARRGPTTILLVGVCTAWYLMRDRRPKLITLIIGGMAIGILALFLFSNRNEIYLGAHRFKAQSPLTVMHASPGNTYTYGGGVIVNREKRGDFFWGRRYLVILLVRPIPSAIWHHEYRDATHALGINDIRYNAGLGRESFESTLGWRGAPGSAPGMVADFWAEFSWLYLIALFIVGYLYATLWRRAIRQDALGVALYAIAVALSTYLVMQTFEALAFRFLLLAFGSWVIGRKARRRGVRIRRERVPLMAVSGENSDNF